MLEDFASLAARYAAMQHRIICHADETALRNHIKATLHRCLPAGAVTDAMLADCFTTVNALPDHHDPMHTRAIHAWAGQYLLQAAASDAPLLHRLHQSALRLLPADQIADRDALRLVTLDALYFPGTLPAGTQLAFLKHRLGLNGSPRLSCEEIAIRLHMPLTAVHELEAAILTRLSSSYYGGSHA